MDYRRKHYLDAGSFPLTTLGGIYMDQLSLTECLDKLTEAMDYAALRDGQQRLREQGVWRGIGIITFIEQTAVGPGLYGAAGVPATSVEECRIRLEADGVYVLRQVRRTRDKDFDRNSADRCLRIGSRHRSCRRCFRR